ncbi:MAG: phage portal protein [Dehalococcoidia bacterium]
MNNLTIPQQLARMDRDRMRRYNENLAFYNGEQWQSRATRGEKHLTFNYAKALVDKTTSYLMSGMSFALDPMEEGDEARERARSAEKALYQVYQDNNLQALDFDTELDCTVLGDAAYKVTWDIKERRVKVTAPDVQGLYAWWLPDDMTTLYRVASRYQLAADEVEVLYPSLKEKPGPSVGRPVGPGNRVEVVEVWSDRTFELWIDNDRVTSNPNPYGFIPFIIFPNLRQPKKFWGISDIPLIMEGQRELNRALSQLSRILELSGNPIAVLENIEASEDIAVQPGAVWNIPEDARAYLLDLLQGGGVRLHIDYIELLYRTLHDISESPRAAFGTTERDLSGVALEIEMQPLLQKVRRKRLIRTAVYRRRNEMILSLIERFTGHPDLSRGLFHRIIWGPVLPLDRQRQVSNEVQLIQSGVHSRKRAMEEMGILDPETEFDNWLEERKRILQMNRELAGGKSPMET